MKLSQLILDQYDEVKPETAKDALGYSCGECGLPSRLCDICYYAAKYQGDKNGEISNYYRELIKLYGATQ